MAEFGTVPQETRERIEEIGSADLVIGLLASNRDHQEISQAISRVRESLATFSGAPQAVVVHPNVPNNDLTFATAEENALRVLPYPLFTADPSVAPTQNLSDAFRTMYTISQNLGSRACCVIASDLSTVTPEWISRLIQPAFEREFDLVAPCYTRHRLEGLINKGILYPLFRALYGRQIRNPLGPDFGLSSRMIQKIALGLAARAGIANRMHPVASLSAEAITGGFQVCQTNLGVRVYQPTDWMNLSTLLAQILGPLFLDIERNAVFWQRVRGSQPVPEFGEPAFASQREIVVDVRPLIESFQLGARNLGEVWSAILPPSTLVELRRIARLTPDQFHIPDDLWARVVYDFVLGHHLRTISRDHLLRAITPLYLGWVASYAIELDGAGAEPVEWKLEKLTMAYENAKPYFVSRWRWPDRFNP